jgi:threonine/homoserine/homoserine lactone efflux protein
MGGWKRGAIVAIAPLISDIPLIIVILVLLNQIPNFALRAISLIGGVYVIYLAWKLFQAWKSPPFNQLEAKVNFPQNLMRAVLVNYSSPGPYMFWTLVNGPLLLSALRTSIFHGIVFLISFYSLFIGGMLGLVGIFSQAGRLASHFVRVLKLISVIILSLLGIIMIYRGVIGIL